MIRSLAMQSFFGVPMVAFGGFATLALLLTTASISYLSLTRKVKISMKWHPRFAVATIIFAFIHAFFALSIYLGY